MFISKKITVDSATTPVLIFTLEGNVNDLVPVTVYNASTHTLLIGGKTKTTCIFPLLKGQSKPFGILGDSLYARSTTGTQTVYLLIGRQD